MNAEEQEIDGTKPSEGGSIVISHDEEPVNNKAPGSTITPTVSVPYEDGGLKPFNQDLVNDAPVNSNNDQMVDNSKSIFSDASGSNTNIATQSQVQPTINQVDVSGQTDFTAVSMVGNLDKSILPPSPQPIQNIETSTRLAENSSMNDTNSALLNNTTNTLQPFNLNQAQQNQQNTIAPQAQNNQNNSYGNISNNNGGNLNPPKNHKIAFLFIALIIILIGALTAFALFNLYSK